MRANIYIVTIIPGECIMWAEPNPTPPPASRSSQGSARDSQENRAVMIQRGEGWDEVSV